jgi:hypothetical protein
MPPLSEELRWLGRRGGREGFEVTSLGFGAATISNHHEPIQMSEAAAIDAVFAAWDTGVRYFDTAPWYGRTRSERRLGLALNNYERSSFRLQTKVGRFLVPGQTNDQDSHGGEIINPAGGYPNGGHTSELASLSALPWNIYTVFIFMTYLTGGEHCFSPRFAVRHNARLFVRCDHETAPGIAAEARG